MTRYVCDFCQKDIDGKPVIMTCECPTIMPRLCGSRTRFDLHLHDNCARMLIGQSTIEEHARACAEADRRRAERKKAREELSNDQ